MKRTTTLILVLIGLNVSAYAQQEASQPIATEIDSSKIVHQYSAQALQAIQMEESSNPEDFGFEKVIVNGEEVWIKQTDRIRIVYKPKNQ